MTRSNKMLCCNAQVCLFSYGQTGAGKTHTMQGTRARDGRGITPRALEQARAFAAIKPAAALSRRLPAWCWPPLPTTFLCRRPPLPPTSTPQDWA